ncbi:hypothetical protein TSUD_289290 [Trifolium subterraneum]|uniref:Uncharacterized protein n=1 Tax=Trifolium subterraneum TaxID=3900 RepID=A0A2Z6M2L0_TRISU|nr:hypothetical protein TSUD_289290 [Trifolium subterraneum]
MLHLYHDSESLEQLLIILKNRQQWSELVSMVTVLVAGAQRSWSLVLTRKTKSHTSDMKVLSDDPI